MLYITTRDRNEVFTAPISLQQDRAKDGGLFVPFHFPEYDEDDIAALKEKSFGQIVAQIMNLFFSARITGWDVEFRIGRSPVRHVTAGRRILVAETWNNPDSEYAYLVSSLYDLIIGNAAENRTPTEWFRIAARVSTLFGLFGELMRSEPIDRAHPVDVAVAADDLSSAVSVMYARQMGLPIGNIICSCSETSAAWDLIRRGELNTGVLAGTENTLSNGLERLIQSALGCKSVLEYQKCASTGGIFTLSTSALSALNSGVFAAVVGKARVDSVTASVYRTNAYTLGRDTALAYGGLQDYRAIVGEGRLALLLSECPASV